MGILGNDSAEIILWSDELNKEAPPLPDIETPARSPLLKVEIGLHGGLFLLGCAVLCFSFLMRSPGESLVYLPGFGFPLPDLCSSKQLLGLECPGCGLTRSFIAISHGEFEKAWNLNPASFLAYAFVIGQIPWQIYQLSRIRRGRLPINAGWIYALPALTAGGLFLQWVIKLFFSS